MKLEIMIKSIFIILILALNTSLKRMKKGTSKTLYNNIVESMEKCKANKEKCCSSTALWIKDGVMPNEKIMKKEKHMKDSELASTIDLKIDQIKAALEKQKIVYIAINPDHHFIVFKEDKSDFVDIYQSFEGSYNLEKWIKYYFSDHKNQLLFKDFIDHLREFMNFNPVQNQIKKRMKNDLVYLRNLFCINEDHNESKIKKAQIVKDWFYDFKYFARRYFKQISYSSFPKENSFNFISCKTKSFKEKIKKLRYDVFYNIYNKKRL